MLCEAGFVLKHKATMYSIPFFPSSVYREGPLVVYLLYFYAFTLNRLFTGKPAILAGSSVIKPILPFCA